MATDTREARQRLLQEAFLQVAFRANRLKEWMSLHQTLRSLETSFGNFSSDVRDFVAGVSTGQIPTAGGPYEQRLERLDMRWNRWHRTDFMDLQAFARGVRHINRSAHNETAEAPPVSGGLPKIDISQLEANVTPIGTALAGRQMGSLAQQCTSFETTLSGLIAYFRYVITRELDELCEITIQLQMRFSEREAQDDS